MVGLRALLFDLDNTLVPTREVDKAAYAKVVAWLCENFREAAGDEGEVAGRRVVAEFERALAAEPWDTSGQLGTTEWRSSLWLGSARRGLGSADDAGAVPDSVGRQLFDVWMEARMAGFRLSAEVEAMVRALKAEGYLVAVLTNGDEMTQAAKLRACQAANLFSPCLIGHVEGPKPDPAIFHKAMDALGVAPGECLMIGDKPSTDIQGAINAGLAVSVLVDPQLRPDPQPKPDYVVRSVLELPSVLQRLVRA